MNSSAGLIIITIIDIIINSLLIMIKVDHCTGYLDLYSSLIRYTPTLQLHNTWGLS